MQNYVLGIIRWDHLWLNHLDPPVCSKSSIWASLIIGLRRLKTKNHSIKRFIDGAPVVLIKHGVLDVEACRKAKITADEVAFKLRREVYHITT